MLNRAISYMTGFTSCVCLVAYEAHRPGYRLDKKIAPAPLHKGAGDYRESY
jgi:hypothetical protein